MTALGINMSTRDPDLFYWPDPPSYGKPLDFEAAVNLMDDDIREQLHDELAPCTPQVFFDAYVSAHAEKFGEDWILDNPNPVW